MKNFSARTVLQLTFAKRGLVGSAVKVVVADGVHGLGVGAMKKLLFGHVSSSVSDLHLILLPSSRERKQLKSSWFLQI